MLDERRPVHLPRSLSMLVMVRAVKQRHIPNPNPNPNPNPKPNLSPKPNLYLSHFNPKPNLSPKPNPRQKLWAGKIPPPLNSSKAQASRCSSVSCRENTCCFAAVTCLPTSKTNQFTNYHGNK